ncbi:hypothetical protein [Paramaledivibacter caminithermalis]|jgi:multidrug transporter EmrE-like cation transporter|uniref:EamA-like transporter family protein n=1 Tax=Paramaledivibacter caminithermalis (strain DSM 15212 / CIP 107654 / DViRD3) TaxID=1121301 RepID=A0A1M6LZ19_PARC5|nr:hypothetical protein [Paramaledivibacter caminithermalis]SHJ76459.1 hypothetical protein SAMN02745912_00989 [Paramaledivibacter caminithermalis DSM 15212]
MIYLLISLYLFFTVSGLVLLKIGGQTFSFLIEDGKIHIIMSWKFMLGFASYVCSFIIWTFMLQKFNLTYMYPILVGLAYVLVLFAGFFILQEKLTIFNVIGSLIILIGIVLMNIKK